MASLRIRPVCFIEEETLFSGPSKDEVDDKQGDFLADNDEIGEDSVSFYDYDEAAEEAELKEWEEYDGDESYLQILIDAEIRTGCPNQYETFQKDFYNSDKKGVLPFSYEGVFEDDFLQEELDKMRLDFTLVYEIMVYIYWEAQAYRRNGTSVAQDFEQLASFLDSSSHLGTALEVSFQGNRKKHMLFNNPETVRQLSLLLRGSSSIPQLEELTFLNREKSESDVAVYASKKYILLFQDLISRHRIKLRSKRMLLRTISTLLYLSQIITSPKYYHNSDYLKLLLRRYDVAFVF